MSKVVQFHRTGGTNSFGQFRKPSRRRGVVAVVLGVGGVDPKRKSRK